MAKDEKNYMPQSGAGLMRFSEDNRDALIRFKPEHVIIMGIVTGGALVALKFLA